MSLNIPNVLGGQNYPSSRTTVLDCKFLEAFLLSSLPGSLLEMQNCKPCPRLTDQKLHFNKIPRHVRCILRLVEQGFWEWICRALLSVGTGYVKGMNR